MDFLFVRSVLPYNRQGQGRQGGYVLIAVLVLLMISLAMVSNTLTNITTSTRSVYATKVRNTDFNEVESSTGHAVSWLRVNSQRVISPFKRDEFYAHFERTDPSFGTNDTTDFHVPTKIKLAGTTNSALLVSSSDLGTPAFPNTRDLTTGSAFPAQNNFATTDFGSSLVRLTLIDALPENPAKDYGPPPNPAPETDFIPVYRVDTMNATDRGSHVYGIITTDTNNLFDYGVYGEDYLELRQACDSYDSTLGAYVSANKRANCPASSNSTSQIHKSEVVYGTLRTNGEINEEPPYGGKVCSDFESGCPNEGETCSGEDCGVPLLEQFKDWSVYCPVDQGDLTVAANTTLLLSGSDPMHNCWNKVTVQTGVTLTLSSTSAPYYIKTLELKNSSNSRLDVNPDDVSKYVQLYIQTLVGNKINGNQTVNATGRPYNFRLYYLGTTELVLNGTATMNVALVSPKAAVSVTGTFDYSGALLAKQLLLNGSGQIHYDESLGGNGDMYDSQYRLTELIQKYR